MPIIIDKSQQSPTRRLRARGKARRENLLEAACQLLTEKTAEEVSFKDIYELAEVPPGSAYHFFENLEKLGEQAVQRWDQPDAGLWEYRTRENVHTFSSVMCWAACDRLAKIATRLEIADKAALTMFGSSSDR